MHTIQLEVPEGAEAGDSLSFVVDGKDLEFPVPEGSKPGDALEIQVDGNESNEEDDDEEDGGQSGKESLDSNGDVTLPLAYRKSLSFSSKLPPTAETSKDPNDKTEVPVLDDGTYAHPWPAGLALCRFLGTEKARHLMQALFGKQQYDVECINESTEQQEQINVLELGSGLGLVGLTFVARYLEMNTSSSSLLPSLGRTVLSDVPRGLDLLRHNLQRNLTTLSVSAANICVMPLQWGEKSRESVPPSNEKEEFNLVLASDVLYNTDSIPALISTVKDRLARNSCSKSAFLLAVRWRKPDIERSFFEALEGWQGKHWHLIHTLHSPLSWKEYGNPQCEASNRYFHQTMVSVQGKPHSLAEISGQTGDNDDSKKEEDQPGLLENMDDQESEVFENCFVQIYCLSNGELKLDDKRPRSNADLEDGPKKSRKA